MSGKKCIHEEVCEFRNDDVTLGRCANVRICKYHEEGGGARKKKVAEEENETPEQDKDDISGIRKFLKARNESGELSEDQAMVVDGLGRGRISSETEEQLRGIYQDVIKKVKKVKS
jgi:hypothetical protein